MNVSLGTEIQKEVAIHITDESVQKEKRAFVNVFLCFSMGDLSIQRHMQLTCN